MKLTLSADPSVGEAFSSLSSVCEIPLVDFQRLIAAYGSFWDEWEPKDHPRTPQEVWWKIASEITKKALSDTLDREKVLAERALSLASIVPTIVAGN